LCLFAHNIHLADFSCFFTFFSSLILRCTITTVLLLLLLLLIGCSSLLIIISICSPCTIFSIHLSILHLQLQNLSFLVYNYQSKSIQKLTNKLLIFYILKIIVGVLNSLMLCNHWNLTLGLLLMLFDLRFACFVCSKRSTILRYFWYLLNHLLSFFLICECLFELILEQQCFLHSRIITF